MASSFATRGAAQLASATIPLCEHLTQHPCAHSTFSFMAASRVQELFHPDPTTSVWADVVLPLPLPQTFTYRIPEELVPQVQRGVRVEVPFGKGKYYAALVWRVHREAPSWRTKPILSVLDEAPIVSESQLQLWAWIAEYYLCTLGEVMDVALPSHLKLASERLLVLGPLFDDFFDDLSEKEHLIAQALRIRHELPIGEVRKIVAQKSIMPLVKQLLDKRLVYIKESLHDDYRPRTIGCVRLAEPYRSRAELIEQAFEKCGRSQRQEHALLALIQLARKKAHVSKKELIEAAGIDYAVIRALEKKGILETYERQVSRLYADEDTSPPDGASSLSEAQQQALNQIKGLFAERRPVLLHGVTSSGKTRLYIELMREVLRQGGQVLYLLPEVALTTQLFQRLRRHFRQEEVLVYHHKLSQNERVELWREVRKGRGIVTGARSALLLPFTNLQLIIVDEEHDPSFKQSDPAPRYHARDAALWYAHHLGIPILLGSATPAVESYLNARKGKYGLVSLSERFGGIRMPEMMVADLRQARQNRQMQAHFTPTLLDAIKEVLARQEQVILFQNRRGFATALRCQSCAWTAECRHCDVTLTYHKHFNNLQCHYCGYHEAVAARCPACGSNELVLKGFGTEKVEDDLRILLPEARVARLDFDTARSRKKLHALLEQFAAGRIDILVGTQMVTKGLDFEHVGLVGILSADQLWRFPDFRAAERAFQLMVQVAGRAGRRHRRGRVVIQAEDTTHPLLQYVLANDYASFFAQEALERRQFGYPPFQRLIKITVKHKKAATANEAAKLLAHELRKQLGPAVLGPAIPLVGRIRNWYLLDVLIKVPPRLQLLHSAKEVLRTTLRDLRQRQGLSGTRWAVDVDP